MADNDDAGKVPKEAVDYRLGGDHCHACRYFTEDEGDEDTENEDMETGWCDKVAGEIDAHFWCRLFARRVATLAQGYNSPPMPTMG